MAAPSDAGRAGTNITTAATSWTVNLPASVAAGDFLVAYGRTAGAQTFNLPTGWQWAIQNNTSDATDDAVSIIYKVAAGNEGTSFSWGLGASGKGGAISYRITGHDGGIWLPVPTPATYTTSANTANPPATGTMTSDDYLVLAFAGHDGETSTFTAAPTNYVNLTSANSGTAGAVATNCIIASASRGLTAITTEDPGTFTHGAASNGGLACTLAVRQLMTRTGDFKRGRYTNQAVNRGATW